MAVIDRGNIRRLVAALLTGAAVCAYSAGISTAFAQESGVLPSVADDAKLLLSANELVYNQDDRRVIAVGAVQINYGRYKMVAQKVEYNQQTGRVTATGNIELIEPDGNRVYADVLDVTDNFAEGFINALRVETTDNTRFAAESGERFADDRMVLNNGVYTACLPCAQNPDKAPIWQVKAERVIHNGKTRTVRLEKARFELFGRSIAFLPALELPDHTVKRKSGFLFPRWSVTDNLGFGVTVPYYYAISNHMDATVSGTYFTNQGLLLEGEVRQRFERGDHTFRFAGIDQRSPESFDAGTSDAQEDLRGMVASKGDFKINPRWSFGWDVMLQSDNNFAKTYDLEDLNETVRRNQVYLTGLGRRNYFDARAFYFDVQDKDDPDSQQEERQAMVYPSLDYRFIAPEPVAGGELTINANVTNLTRLKDDQYFDSANNLHYRGVEGTYTRFTAEAEWKRTFTMPSGLQLTPLLAARGDGIHSTMTPPTGTFSADNEASRYMLTAGLEARYPILVTTANSSHVFEPVAQLFVRPSEQMAGRLPNEDSQSFNFDATTLFERDKYSGYDRIEGGTRANVGIRYTGSFDNGIGLRAIAGQSFHLGGRNSFAHYDITNAGANSGLETDSSDYVAMAAVDLPNGFTLAANTRLDERSLDVRQTDALVGYKGNKLESTLSYTRIQPQPEYGNPESTEIVHTNNALKLDENWSVLGSMTWDIEKNDVTRFGVGLSYADECTIFSVNYTEKSGDTRDEANSWKVMARLSFRTLGDLKVGGGGTFDNDD